MLKVLLVDDHAVVREGVAAMLGAQGDIEVVGQAGSLAEGHALLERALSAPATGKLVAVIDVTMPDGSGLSLVRKSSPAEQVISAVRRAAEMPLEFSASGLAEAMRRRSEAPQATLTARESEVLKLLVEGASVTQVGRALYMSPSTVKTHIGKIYDKLGAHNRASVVIMAVRLGLIGDQPPT